MPLENLVRFADGCIVAVDDIKSVSAWLDTRTSEHEIAFHLARVLSSVASSFALTRIRPGCRARQHDVALSDGAVLMSQHALVA